MLIDGRPGTSPSLARRVLEPAEGSTGAPGSYCLRRPQRSAAEVHMPDNGWQGAEHNGRHHDKNAVAHQQAGGKQRDYR